MRSPEEHYDDRLAAIDALREAAWRILCLHGMPIGRRVPPSEPHATRIVGSSSLERELASVVGQLHERLAAIHAVLARSAPVAVSA